LRGREPGTIAGGLGLEADRQRALPPRRSRPARGRRKNLRHSNHQVNWNKFNRVLFFVHAGVPDELSSTLLATKLKIVENFRNALGIMFILFKTGNFRIIDLYAEDTHISEMQISIYGNQIPI